MTDNHALRQARAQVQHIVQLVAAESTEEGEQALYEAPLSVEFRSGWSLYRSALEPAEVRVVMCTGGPHVELLAAIDDGELVGEVTVVYKDWGTHGQLVGLEDAELDALQTFVRRFL